MMEQVKLAELGFYSSLSAESDCPDSEISFPPLLSQFTLLTHASLSHGACSFRASSLRFGISQGGCEG